MHKLAILYLTFLAVTTWAADAETAVVVSAASSTVGVAPDSLATVFGSNISTVTEAATGLPWPTRLGDVSVVYVTDSTPKMQMASIFYVSSTQMNIWIPPGVAPGPATVQFPVTGLGPGIGTAALRTVPVTINKVAPGLFSANGTGSGVAAATAVRIVIPTSIQSPVPVYSCEPVGCSAIPIDVGIDAPVYLSLYGTGIRGASSLDNVMVTIGDVQIRPTYAGPETQTPGLDQVNVPLLLSLRGKGLVNVTVTVDGVKSNAVQIAIQ
jgi:uncharacterized protein (TIGR03437 family)